MAPTTFPGTLLGRENEILGPVSTEVRARFSDIYYERLRHIYPQIHISLVPLLLQIDQVSDGLSGKQNCIRSKCPWDTQVATSPTCVAWASNFYKKF